MLLSAYLLYHPYCTNRSKFGVKDLGNFYLKRGLRIIPEYAVALFFAYLVGYFDSPIEMIVHLFGVHGMGHFWYMPVIMKFYLIAPVFLWIKTKVNSRGNILLLIVAIMLSSICNPYTSYTENSMELKWYLPVFLMGMLLAEVLDWLKKKDISECLYGDLLAIGCVGIGVMFLPYVREKLWEVPPSNWLQNKYIFYGGLWFFIIAGISLGKYMKRGMEKLRILTYIGKISFGIYLFHYVILAVVVRKSSDFWWYGGITLVMSVILAALVDSLKGNVIKRIRKRQLL